MVMNTRDPEKEQALELPPVNPEQASTPVANKTEVVKQLGTERNPELLPADNSVQQPVLPQVAADNSTATPQSPTNSKQSSQDATLAAQPMPQIADDIDLIEKEWVEKAKDIVNKTKDNPHVQNRELNKVKSEYIRQRFNKNLQAKDDA